MKTKTRSQMLTLAKRELKSKEITLLRKEELKGLISSLDYVAEHIDTLDIKDVEVAIKNLKKMIQKAQGNEVAVATMTGQVKGYLWELHKITSFAETRNDIQW